MAMINSEVISTFEEIVKKDQNDNIIETKKIKVIKRVFPCRPQVNERKNWPKFGEVAGIPRGINKPGDITVNQQIVVFETDQGNVDE